MKEDHRDNFRVRHLAITMTIGLLMCLVIGCNHVRTKSRYDAMRKAPNVQTTRMAGVEASAGFLRVHHPGTGQPANGTGFLVAPNRVVTCLHVVTGATSAEILFPSGVSRPITGIVAEDTDNDLAILTITPTGAEPSPLSLAPVQAQIGDKVVVHGYPDGPSQKMSRGKVTCIGPSWGIPVAIIADVQATYGFSGGPVLDDKHMVVGIVSSHNPGIVVEGRELVKDAIIITPVNCVTSLPMGPSRPLKDWTKARGAVAVADAALSCGQIEGARENWDVASQQFQKAIQLDPKNFRAWAMLGRCLQNKERYEQAIVAGEKALALKSQFPEASHVVAESLIKCRRYSEATAILERCVQMNPDSDREHLLLGTAYAYAGQFEKARKQCRILKPINSEAAEYLLGAIQSIEAEGKEVTQQIAESSEKIAKSMEKTIERLKASGKLSPEQEAKLRQQLEQIKQQK